MSPLALIAPRAVASTLPPSTGFGHHDHSSHDHGDGDGARGHGHEGDEGFALQPATSETVTRPSSCVGGAPVRRYRVVAIDVDISLNRYLDHDPDGRMYVLEQDLERVRAEEAKNARARAADASTTTTAADPAVSLGLQGDAIQPLTLRVRPGECLEVGLRTELEDGEPATIHLHGAAWTVARTGEAAVAGNPDAVARPEKPVTYRWMVDESEREATHYFHSHGNTRVQTSHGLFGAVVVEPPGATWTDPLSGADDTTGWSAIVAPSKGRPFREFVVYYHELGDETFQPLDRHDRLVPQVDPITHIYRPDGRALNYRSEPFMNRLAIQQARGEPVDESLEYSSYAYGDPATPIMRAYLGDPVKQRVVHGGSEVFHVHHVHGGGIRWRKQLDDADVEPGLDKRPALLPSFSDRTDSTSVGPSETFDLVNECGAGGCQQSVGDFMFHCHVTDHYFAGMWGIWRVYNTLQAAEASTDGLPPLLPLPDRRDAVAPAVTSDRLAGTEVDWYGDRHRIDDVRGWVRSQLPPPGAPGPYDASVHDWTFDGDVALGEPETADVWPAYRARAPSSRPPILFDPRSGKVAYPFLRPHLLRRPPFAPGHGPAPFLDPFGNGRAPPAPGANGPASVCPNGTRSRPIPINAIAVPVVQSRKDNIVDSRGQIYVRRDELDRVRAEEDRRLPLVVRTNAQQDCVDVLYRSELEDSVDDPFNKSGLHIHFMQFDVQGSDGVDLGFNFEQTVRPFRLASQPLARRAAAGETRLAIADPRAFHAGAVIGVGMDEDATFEAAVVAGVEAGALLLADPLEHAHDAGALLSTEFVRYRWYPDAQFGTAFFHDHVNVPFSGRHGLYGAVVAEPPDATWHDPHTGSEVASGLVADVRTEQPLGGGLDGSFRELVLGLQDDNPLSHVGGSNGSAVSLRVEPLDQRRARAPDPSELFSSRVYGDPETPMVEAYVGDAVAMRTFVGANDEIHSLHVDGHVFRAMPFDDRSRLTSNVHLGISERADLFFTAGGLQRMPGDYLWYNGRNLKLREGSWGLVRVLGDVADELQRLPGRESPSPPPASSVCPDDAPRREFDVAAIDVALPMLGGKEGKVFVSESQRSAVEAGTRPPSPLVLRVDVGDCVVVNFRNRTEGGPVTFHADRLLSDPQRSAGVTAGRNESQGVAAGASRTYELFAAPELGEGAAMVRDFGDVLVNPALGLYGAIVVGPKGARYVDPTTGDEVDGRLGWRVDVLPTDGTVAFRDVVLFFQDTDESIGTHKMPYTTSVDGAAAINYRSAPLAPRLTKTRDPATVLSAGSPAGPPATPIVSVRSGDPVRLHVLSPSSEQAQVFSLDGHEWPTTSRADGPRQSSSALVALDVLDLDLYGGAGSPARLPGDYVFGNHREAYREAGQWGILRVLSCGDGGGPEPLPGSPCGGRGTGRPATGPIVAALLVGLAAVGAVTAVRHRRRARSVS